MAPDGDERLRLDYDQTTQVLRLLTDIRFKLIAFVPTIAAFSVGLFGKPRPAVELLAIGLLGMTATLGILLYELRNSQIYAAAAKRPMGPELVLDLWGDALVAFAWQCVLGIASGIAAATGKDARGNLLVPVELVAGARGVGIVPMARHRFAGSSGLKPTITRR